MPAKIGGLVQVGQSLKVALLAWYVIALLEPAVYSDYHQNLVTSQASITVCFPSTVVLSYSAIEAFLIRQVQ